MMLKRGSREQVSTMERLQLIFSELLQVEKTYEISLRRIAAYKCELTLSSSLNTQGMMSQQQNNSASGSQPHAMSADKLAA